MTLDNKIFPPTFFCHRKYNPEYFGMEVSGIGNTRTMFPTGLLIALTKSLNFQNGELVGYNKDPLVISCRQKLAEIGDGITGESVLNDGLAELIFQKRNQVFGNTARTYFVPQFYRELTFVNFENNSDPRIVNLNSNELEKALKSEEKLKIIARSYHQSELSGTDSMEKNARKLASKLVRIASKIIERHQLPVIVINGRC